MSQFKKIVFYFLAFPGLSVLFFSNINCKVYKFNDVTIPSNIKTVYVRFIDNQAPIKNPLLSPELTNKLRTKIVNQTRLTQVTSENADYYITGKIYQYDVTTSGISNQQVATNRLTVGVEITLNDNKTPGTEPKIHSVSRSFDFSASLTLTQAEQRLNDEIIRNLTDEIFNRIFSDW
ncbi:MAG TPA: LPS assembly lipoprotein LptE [Chitinophagaceae bacterium]|nr:LPS assembly lipoprotein LptE [Chitinophagaceae bacterium]